MVNKIVLLLLIYSVSLFATEQEAGAYERKSVSYVNRVILLDNSVNQNMPSAYSHLILSNLKNAILLDRFDRNPLSEKFLENFNSEINTILPKLSGDNSEAMDSISSIMDRTIVPKIISIVNEQKNVRAELLLTEQQKNSFITDKAKEQGITADELSRVMNSAFIFLPFARNFSESQNRDTKQYHVNLDIGVMIWKIDVNGEITKAVNLMRTVMDGTGSSTLNETYLYRGASINYKEYAFRQLLNGINMNLEVAVKEVEAFKLRSQVGEKNAFTMTFDLGKKAGVKVNNKYLIIRNIEQPDGSILQEKGGWIRVTKVGLKGKDETSKAAIVSGSPNIGSEIKEYPRIPLDISIKWRNYRINAIGAKNIDTTKTGYFNNFKTKDSWAGIQLQINTDLGRYIKVPQFYFGVEAGIGLGGYTGDVLNEYSDIKSNGSYILISYGGSLMKKFFIRRVGLILDPAFTGQYLIVTGKKHNYSILSDKNDLYTEWVNTSIGFTPRGGVEVAITPFLNVGVTVGYQLFLNNNEWQYREKEDKNKAKWKDVDVSSPAEYPEINSNGMVLSVYTTISLPRLP